MSRLLIVRAVAASTSAAATTISWTDWSGLNPNAGTAVGSIAAPSGTVGVSDSGGYASGPTQTACGTAWWIPGSCTGTFNNPFACDIIALSAGGTKTITFDTEVVDPYMALMSWNGNTVAFSAPIEVVANGSGYCGSGTPIVNSAGNGFFGQGEVHGIVRFNGTFRSITFTDTGEFWHGFTIGIADRVADPDPRPLPLSGTLALRGLGLLAASMAGRRRAACRRGLAPAVSGSATRHPPGGRPAAVSAGPPQRRAAGGRRPRAFRRRPAPARRRPRRR